MRYKTCNKARVMQHCTVHNADSDDTYYELRIAVNEKACGVTVTAVSMIVYKDVDAGEGDLAVEWDCGTMTDSDMQEVMHKFYAHGEYTKRLRDVLLDAGFSSNAASDVDGSESGMQDYGRASYDAYSVAKQVRWVMKQA